MSDTVLSKHRIQPTASEQVGPVDISVYGRTAKNWRLDRTQPGAFAPIVAQLPESVHTLWAPIPSKANALVVHHRNFQIEDRVGNVRVMGRVFADGVGLLPGDAFVILSADCPTAIMWSGNRRGLKPEVVVAHAGRDSLFDKNRLLGTGHARRSGSVIPAMATYLMGQQDLQDVEDVHLHICCGIRTGFAHPQLHPQYGAYNRALLKECKRYIGGVKGPEHDEIDLYSVIRGQAMELGIHAVNITFDLLDTNRDPRLASNRRNPGERNLVIVHYR